MNKQMEKTVFSERLGQVLHEEGLRQVDLLEKAKSIAENSNTKITKSDLSQYISGKVIPGTEKLSLIALTLGVNEAWLLGFYAPKKRNGQTFDL